MIIVPEPRVVTGRSSVGYNGIVDPDKRIFTKAMLSLDPELKRWRSTIAEILKEDQVSAVESVLRGRSPRGPGGLCVKINMRIDPNLHTNREYHVVECKNDSEVDIVGCSAQACFWGFQTTRQILRQTRSTFEETLRVEDFPEFATRGVLLDISRDRVPRVDFLKSLIRNLSSAKINHLELYMEHTFAYRGHESAWAGSSAYTASEVQEIDAFCADHFITLVPCQNTLGHMHRWLKHDRYRDLAELPAGVSHPFGHEREPFSLCPSDPRSLELVSDLLGQLVPLFKTNRQSGQPLVNVNLDEPFDLGRRAGRTRGRRGPAVAAYANKVNKIVQDQGARMLMWADAVTASELDRLPRDATLIEWGYEEGHRWTKRLRMLGKRGHSVWVAPGTSSWGSIAGRTKNALNNLREAAVHGAANGAQGYLIADWGDYGHHQQPCISYIGYLVGAASAWGGARSVSTSASGRETEVAAWSDLLGFFQNELLATAAYRLGAVYAELPRPPNFALLWLALPIAEPMQDNHLVRFVFENYTVLPYPRTLLRLLGPAFSFCVKHTAVTRSRLLGIKHRVQVISVGCLAGQDPHGPQTRQLILTAEMIVLLVDVWLVRLAKGLHRPAADCKFDMDGVNAVLRKYRDLWPLYSRPGGLEDSVAKLLRMVGADQPGKTAVVSAT